MTSDTRTLAFDAHGFLYLDGYGFCDPTRTPVDPSTLTPTHVTVDMLVRRIHTLIPPGGDQRLVPPPRIRPPRARTNQRSSRMDPEQELKAFAILDSL